MITDKELAELKERVGRRLSEKRFRHTEGVVEEITRMGALYLPDAIPELKAAALLHDVAKELPIEEQIAICREHGDPELDSAVNSPAILHGHAASYLVDAESLDNLFDRMELSRDIEISRREFAEGKGIPNDTVFDRLHKKLLSMRSSRETAI